MIQSYRDKRTKEFAEGKRSRIGGADLQRALDAVGPAVPAVDLRSDAAGPIVPSTATARQRVLHWLAAGRGHAVANFPAAGRVERARCCGTSEEGARIRTGRIFAKSLVMIRAPEIS